MPAAPNRWSLEQDILDDALRDRSELRRLARDPRAALERELGAPLPPELSVRIAFDTPKLLHQVLPFPGHRVLGSLEPPTGEDAITSMRGLLVAAAHRATLDPEFRAHLVADARGFARTGLHRYPLPEDLEIAVLPEDANTIWLTVPFAGRTQLRKGKPRRDRKGRRPRPQP